MRINSQKLLEEFLDIIDNYYSLPNGPELEDLSLSIQIAITSSEIETTKPKLRGLAKVLAKKPRKRKRKK